MKTSLTSKWTYVTFRKDGREKKVLAVNYFSSSEAEKAKLPPSLVKVIEWERNFPQ